MNKNQLVDQISAKTKMTKIESEKVLNATLKIIKTSIKKGSDVKLVGFGTFTRQRRKARKGRNLKTGAEVAIPSKWHPKFRPSSEFKNMFRS